MSRGVVIWPDSRTEPAIRGIWDALAAVGLPSLATHTHRRHLPHVSLAVGAKLDPAAAESALGAVPAIPIPFNCPSSGVFPASEHSGGGMVLYLSVAPSARLLDEHLRVHAGVSSALGDRWPFFEPDGWMPHITLAFGITAEQLALAVPIVNAHLPLAGTFKRGGVEDGDTAERWLLDG